MNWSSAADFFVMGGYGFYVWGSFGMTAVVILAELIALRARRSALVRAVRDAQDGSAPAGYSGAPHEA